MGERLAVVSRQCRNRFANNSLLFTTPIPLLATRASVPTMSDNTVCDDDHSLMTQPTTTGGDTSLVQTITPLPKLQILSVSMIQLTEPITALVIYPFINQLIRETGITKGNDARSGYYAGVIESTFFLSEALTVVQWGYLSDRYGRRPILLIAPIGLIVAMLAFGSSRTFWPLLLSRFFQGIFNGTIGISKSVIAEITDSTNRGDAYAFMPMTWSVGQVIGPLIGGILSHPENRWPDTLGRISYLLTHPYFLPCAVSALFALLAFAFSFVCLKESLPVLVAKEKEKQRRLFQTGDTERTPLLIREEETVLNVPEPTRPTIDSVLVRPVIVALINMFCLTYVDMCHFSLQVLFYSTPIHLGGLGLDPSKIGTIMGVYGCCNGLIQLRFLGPTIRRFGVRNVFSVTYSSLLVVFTMYPLMSYFAQRAGEVDGFVVAFLMIQLACNVLITMAYGSIQVIIVESVPEGGPIGTVNGVAQMLSSGSRIISPTFASSLFSISVQRNLLGGYMWAFFALPFYEPPRRIPEE
ncbi:hypothetical protein D9619_004782 [Psilocybe cf. subviscida]|uniref:Major facilitator superfamily (MFS) profile domain-containing protein n=1 Tax=Psilocybe cf. subviscida TaxID=2480587 RepID=A0A8H5BP95_9AGAR|nr:hypothetical protein D9619_004782 [Psilocybe cf. subviscida]